MISEAYIVAGARTPTGRFLGGLRSLTAPELGAIVIRECLSRAQLDPSAVDEVILGNVVSAGVGQAPARQAALKAGLPPTVSALTVNKVCGSALQAVMLAAQAIRAGDARVVVAGGMECMSRAPFLLQGAREGIKLGNTPLFDALIHDGLWCAFEDCHMGQHAEHTARSCGVSRVDQDEFAVESHRRAVAAQQSGAFDEEIVPVTIRSRKEETVLRQDEAPRADTTVEALSRLRPVFDPQGSVTAGNASPLSDGAAAVVVADRAWAERNRTPWMARIVSYATSGVEPKEIFLAPVAAIQQTLQKVGLTTADVDLFEINEAFSSQMVACQRKLELPPEKVNVHGGAVALGHPIGASGARVLVTLLSALRQRGLKRGVASLCLGGGNAVALLVERPDV